MEMQALIDRQRVKYIVDSYSLRGDEAVLFDSRLEALLTAHPSALLELALTEILTESWLIVPMQRGLVYLDSVTHRLQDWRTHGLKLRLTASQFEQITGLDATATFGRLSSLEFSGLESGGGTSPALPTS
ncbi:MAG: hypothetical protein AAFZ80_03310 [Cyanobacteria bacterium P01_A01_bin.105]